MPAPAQPTAVGHPAPVSGALARPSLALLAAAALAGCATTEQTTSAKPAGFLGDYSKVLPGQEGEVQFLYLDPKADFRPYDSILLEPVTLWVTAESDLEAR